MFGAVELVIRAPRRVRAVARRASSAVAMVSRSNTIAMTACGSPASLNSGYRIPLPGVIAGISHGPQSDAPEHGARDRLLGLHSRIPVPEGHEDLGLVARHDQVCHEELRTRVGLAGLAAVG